MENASKALIIAGAILLAILLISLGILIFNQAQDTVNNGGMSQAEITAFNNKFLKYEGKQKGSVAKSLVNEIIASNADDAMPQIKVKIGSGEATNPTTTSDIDTKKEYTISITSYSSGYVSEISISEQQ